VLRAVLARRGRSIVAVAVGPVGSWLAALLREDVGRFGGSGSSTGPGVAAAEVRRGRVFVAVSTTGFFAGLLGSLVGGRIGVDDFFGDGRGPGTLRKSDGASRGVTTVSEEIDGADSAWVKGDACFVEIGCGAGTGVSVLLLFSGGFVDLTEASPSAGLSASTSGAGESRLRFLAGVLLGVLAKAFLSSILGGLPKRPLIAWAAAAIFRADSSASSAACYSILVSNYINVERVYELPKYSLKGARPTHFGKLFCLVLFLQLLRFVQLHAAIA
jgi:hypothetical protein